MQALLISCSGWKQRCGNWKKTVITFLIILGVMALPFMIFAALAGNEVEKMNVIKSGKLIENIFVGKDGYVNFYIIKGKTGYIIIDTGNKPDNVLNVFEELGVDAEQVKTTLLTHSDRDHVGGLGALNHTEIILPYKEEQVINGEIARTITMFKIPVKNKIESDYRTIKDKEMIKRDGIKIECIWAPGHTAGSSCYLVDDKYLFTGDMISLKRGKADGFIRMFTMDRGENMRSIRRVVEYLKDKNIEYIFTAHHGYSNDFEKAFSGWKN